MNKFRFPIRPTVPSVLADPALIPASLGSPRYLHGSAVGACSSKAEKVNAGESMDPLAPRSRCFPSVRIARAQAILARVKQVLSTGQILQIARHVVGFIAVLVVYLFAFWNRAKERYCHQPMNISVLFTPFHDQANPQISESVIKRTQGVLGLAARCGTSDAPERADFIGRSLCNDSPKFNGSILISQGVNLREQVSFWSGSLEKSHSLAGRFVF